MGPARKQGGEIRAYICPGLARMLGSTFSHISEGRLGAALDYRAQLMEQHARISGISLHTNFDDILEEIEAATQPLVVVAT